MAFKRKEAPKAKKVEVKEEVKPTPKAEVRKEEAKPVKAKEEKPEAPKVEAKKEKDCDFCTVKKILKENIINLSEAIESTQIPSSKENAMALATMVSAYKLL